MKAVFRSQSDPLCVRRVIGEFATYDAGLLLNEFLRTVLQYAYSDAQGVVSEPMLHRSLVLRLLAKGSELSDRYACTLISEQRQGRLQSHCSSSAATLSAHVWREVVNEIASLERVIRREEPEFVLRGSTLDPLCYAHCLDRAIDEALELTPHERNVIFNAWASCFCKVMSRTFQKYLEVAASVDELAVQTKQEFVDTLPLSAQARAMMYAKARGTDSAVKSLRPVRAAAPSIEKQGSLGGVVARLASQMSALLSRAWRA